MRGIGQGPDDDPDIPVLSEDALDSVVGGDGQAVPDTITSD